MKDAFVNNMNDVVDVMMRNDVMNNAVDDLNVCLIFHHRGRV